MGIEPMTNGLLDQRSTDWAMRPFWSKRQWCIGNIEASQALAPGSTPGWRNPFCIWGVSSVVEQSVAAR